MVLEIGRAPVDADRPVHRRELFLVTFFVVVRLGIDLSCRIGTVSHKLSNNQKWKSAYTVRRPAGFPA